jgi:hypothetical protein
MTCSVTICTRLGYSPSGERMEHALGHLSDLRRGIDGRLSSSSEAVDVTVQERVRVRDHLHGEAGRPKTADHRVAVA